MKWQNLFLSNMFSGKNKKNIISLSSAELVQRVIMVKVELWIVFFFFFVILLPV